MRLQHSAIIFVLIFIPIILVTSYFISLQVQTVKLVNDYKEKLLNSTYDAMTAFELNTANEDLSTVSDSLRSIIDASTNIFFNTLCTNLGVSNASKSFVQPFIPAILYTLYDGYYIYSPTNIPEICVDKFGQTIRTSDYGVTQIGTDLYTFDQNSVGYSPDTITEAISGPTVTTVDNNYGQILYKNNDGTYSTQLHTTNDWSKSTYYKRDYILKSYIPYSARYENGGIDVTINYTLDNFLTIEGTVNGVYYTKSGYLIAKDLVQKITVTGKANYTIGGKDPNPKDWTLVSEEKMCEFISKPNDYEVKVYFNDETNPATDPDYISNRDGIAGSTEPWKDAQSAVEYYVKSYIFSQWVYENLGNIEAGYIKNTQYSVSDIKGNILKDIKDDSNKTNLYSNMLYDFKNDHTKPFGDGDPENQESAFYEHKRNVIKNSITYNLILSMLVYSEESKTSVFSMPIFRETEWDRILNNVSIVSFMEGMRCGFKTFNDYAIVTSTNNEISITENEIYYTPRKIDGDGKVNTLEDVKYIETAHRIDCEDLDLAQGNSSSSRGSWLGCHSFKSKEIKYDKVLNGEGKYYYDHKVYTDYSCIVDSNYKVKNNAGNELYDGNTKIYDYLKDNYVNKDSGLGTTEQLNFNHNLYYKLLSYRIAIAKERNNLYKTTAYAENYGWQVEFEENFPPDDKKDATTNNGTINISGRSIKEIKKIEVTLEGARQVQPGVYTANVEIKVNGKPYGSPQTIATTSKNRRTLEFSEDLYEDEGLNKIYVSSSGAVYFKVLSAKVYYK